MAEEFINQITIHVPALLAPPKRYQGRLQLPDLPALREWVAHSGRQPVAGGRHGFYTAMLGTTRPPLAALAWLGATGEMPQAPVAFADAVHLQPGMDDLVVIGPAWLDASADEIDSLAETLATHFQDELTVSCEGGQLFLGAPMLADMVTVPVHEIHARSARQHLPARDANDNGGKRLHSLLNEIQMLLHDHPVNLAREQRGLMTLNGIWIWGEGELDAATANCPDGRYLGGSAIFSGLAQLGKGSKEPLPERLPDEPGSSLLVELDEVVDALDRDDLPAWENALVRIDRDWLAPAIAALRAGKTGSLDLYAGDGLRYRLRRSDLRKFWRRWLPGRQARLKFED